MNRKELQLINDNLFIIIDKTGTIIDYTKAFKLLLKEFVPESIQQFVHPEDLNKFHKALKNCSEKNKACILDVRLKLPKSVYKWFEAKLSWVVETNTINLSLYSIDKRKKELLDLTESLSKEKMLSQMKSKFISTTSHEIRTPLSIIKSSAEVMMMFLDSMKDINLKEQFRSYLININNESDRLSHLINDVLIMQKAETDIIECNKQSTDIVTLIKQTIERHNLIQKDGRIMNLEMEGIPVEVMVDPVLLVYILDNLFSNAFKYSPDSTNPLCEIAFNIDGLTISVKDFGIGIPEKEISQVFNLFYRATNAKSIKGTGLGLNIVKKLVELHGGSIIVSSELNNSTEFMINFPG